MWFQQQIHIKARSRGFHIITTEILEALPQLESLKIGLLHIFIQHTSASLSIGENADPSVLVDLESYFNRQVRENEPYFLHTLEGSDDMPAHIKATLIGPSLSIPVRNGMLALGTWQGIYLCEHRNTGGSRKLMLTLQGEKK